MPSNSLHTLNSQNKIPQQVGAPAKTIVPTVPSVPGSTEKAGKPVVAAMNVPVPATVSEAPTIVAAANDAKDIPKADNDKKTIEPPTPGVKPVQPPTPGLKPLPAVDQKVKEEKEPEKVQVKTPAEEKGLKAGNTGMIPNPLPTPKKHIPKEMDFDIQPISSQMHFDIVDMTGMDFFDIN
jgi:hypothetical protein